VAEGTAVLHASDVAGAIRPALAGEDRELLIGVALDKRNRTIEGAVLAIGGQSFSIVDSVVVMRWVVTRPRASGLILAHNHPSGDSEPSRQDHDVTRAIGAACRAVGIRFLDHVVVSSLGYVSFAERGLVEPA
jgi:DNA repair protein RadC